MSPGQTPKIKQFRQAKAVIWTPCACIIVGLPSQHAPDACGPQVFDHMAGKWTALLCGDRSLTISQIICVGARVDVCRWQIKRENQPKFLSNLEWGFTFFIKAQSFELKSLILAQIERWRHA